MSVFRTFLQAAFTKVCGYNKSRDLKKKSLKSFFFFFFGKENHIMQGHPVNVKVSSAFSHISLKCAGENCQYINRS